MLKAMLDLDEKGELTTAETVRVLQYAIVLTGWIGSAYAVYRIGNRASLARLIPFYALMVVFAAVNLWLFSLPMSHRV